MKKFLKIAVVNNQGSKFLYVTSKLTTCQRKELIIDFIEKAKALMEQELIIDDFYSQMNYMTMNNYEKVMYMTGINKLTSVIKLFD
jgi:hypothetical protein